MVQFSLNHSKIIALVLSVVISTVLLGSITTRFQQVATHAPCMIELPTVVVVGKRASLTAQLPAESHGKL